MQGQAPRWLLRVLVAGENIMFMAIAVALAVIAVIVFARGIKDMVLAPRGAPGGDGHPWAAPEAPSRAAGQRGATEASAPRCMGTLMMGSEDRS